MISYKERTRGLVTHTKLEDFMFCEMLYKQKWEDETIETDGEDDGESDEEEKSTALVIGSAFDLYIQDFEKFNEEYAIVSKRTGKTGKIELTMKEGELVTKMAKEFLRQPLFNQIGQKQYNVKMTYGPLVLSSTPDEFQPENNVIIDNKTCASLQKLREMRDKYRRQLAFAQMIEEAKTGIRHNGIIRAVSKEKQPKFEVYFFHADDLFRERQTMVDAIESLIESKVLGEFRPSPREKCLQCKAYNKCPHSIQESLIIM